LNIASQSGGFSNATVVDDRGDTGWHPSLVVNGGTAYIEYRHHGTGELCFATVPIP